MNKLTLSKQGFEFLMSREGSSEKMYLDVAGLPTIGAGHLLTRSELTSGKIRINDKLVKWREGLTKEQIAQLLLQDIRVHEKNINERVVVTLSQNKFDALVSFSYNVGINAFTYSTLLKKLNAGQYHAVPEELSRWKYAGGKEVIGLINRRAGEAKQWLN
ncbi:lysozyme [Dichelobacter nodosus]|uniref:lysozyme n=1 Tax=Dichelobacter nodosus TaxID=870 RepID=UPI0006801BE7|nr:lysozyme [Dichelobacter nodosus]